LRELEEKDVCTMVAEMDFSSPETSESNVMENVLHYELFFGAIFQLTCVLAIILPISKSIRQTINKRGYPSTSGE